MPAIGDSVRILHQVKPHKRIPGEIRIGRIKGEPPVERIVRVFSDGRIGTSSGDVWSVTPDKTGLADWRTAKE